MSDVITVAAAKLGAKLASFDGVAKFVITGEGAIMQADPKAEADQCARLAEWPHCVPQR